MKFAPKKLYYKIGEVCKIVGVEPYVLRYWEKEFGALSPPKSKSGQRTYRPRDIELLLDIKRLLYEEGFTIAGARKHLGSAHAPAVPAASGARRRKAREAVPSRPSARIGKVREELENILTLLDRG